MEAHILTFLSTVLLLIISHFTQPLAAATATTPNAYTTFIRTSCANTTYPSLCSKTLSPYAADVKSNPLRLCNAALSVSLASAINASATVSKFSLQKGILPRDATAIKDCIENIGDSVDELKQSLKAMSSIGRNANKQFQMANVKTWTSAAITDANTCTDGLAGTKVSAGVKSNIRSVIKSFIRVTSNALFLINHLNY
ncbi:plant invertase/pectin methylesterase inhibitor superfamily protein [Actinidia rufa]|uniref:Plant invertase/pectin methylesterase inhibitor superfamily protein n=1 Tax=Actinidia rufa TaxID=165716 RepID=A0A7J0EDQ0_9ERIC|nr:plant invertase/pectin methylesterase inhibitor superfamily protein [Actinidia rufa]